MCTHTFSEGHATFTLSDPIDHPSYEWPRTILSYDVGFESPVAPDELQLVRPETGEAVPFQLSAVETRPDGTLDTATVHFFAALPSGGSWTRVLERADDPTVPRPDPAVSLETTADGPVLDSGEVRVRLPPRGAAPAKADAIPGPIRGVDRGSGWIGASRVASPERAVEGMAVRETEPGPLFATFEVTYRFAGGGRYTATVRVVAGREFLDFREAIEGLEADDGIHLEWDWSGLDPTHRYAPNFPVYQARTDEPGFDRYEWQAIDASPVLTNNGIRDGIDPETGELTFRLGPYEPWGASQVMTCAAFWNDHTDDAIGVFIDDIAGWRDGEYAVWRSSDTLQGRYYYRNDRFLWRWPLIEGTRSTGIACYDHDRDHRAMAELEAASRAAERGDLGDLEYPIGIRPRTHVTRLRARRGVLDLDRVKDWTLTDAGPGVTDGPAFENGRLESAETLFEDIFTYEDVCQLPWHPPRQNGSIGPPSLRVWYEEWVDGLARLTDDLSADRRRRLVGLCLLFGYLSAGEGVMPTRTMLAGHPNFLADVKSVLGYLAALFPDHPDADLWADQFEAVVRLNTRYHTRPAVDAWNARGGRWTENADCYLWVGLSSVLPAAFLLREHYDGRNAAADPDVARMARWLAGSLSAPFDGETPGEQERLLDRYSGQEHQVWGILEREDGPRRILFPHGAHSTRGTLPRESWLLAQLLRRYRPLVAEHLLWVTDPGDDRSGTDPRTEADPWTVAVDHYRDADPVAPNPGTDPHLGSAKYTGYGLVLRAGVDTPEETSVHLMQLDEGPNYRWGVAGQGGCGVLYYAAAGDVYSHNGKEDVGDRRHHDTDFCTNFGVWKDGAFRSIGRNTLEEPMYDLETVTYGKLTAKDGENAYAWPEYRSRSVLLAGTDYILTYDAVFSEDTEHRFSWFTHVDDELPAIHLIEGGGHRTTIDTDEVHGVWHDGSGDCMAVVSHRDDLAVTNTEAGCRIERPGGVDRAFRDQDRIEHDGDEYAFTGRAGLVREHDAGGTDLTLLDGTRLATDDLALSTPDGASIAVEARVPDGADVDRVDGRTVNRDDAPVPVTVDVGGGTIQGDVDAYLDGDRAPIDRGRTVFEVPPGDHRWEITRSEPTPPRPTIERTETGATDAVVHFTEAPAATGYRVELSRDAGESWDPVSRVDASPATVTGLTPDTKAHVRVIGTNPDRESPPAEEYPLYPSEAPPAPPDGLRVTPDDDGVRLEWGRVLGVTAYTLYRRRADGDWTPIYEGANTEYVDETVPAPSPDELPPVARHERRRSDAPVYEYAVSAADRTGEGERSRVVDTAAGWHTWDPASGEEFRRRVPYVFDLEESSVSSGEVPPYPGVEERSE